MPFLNGKWKMAQNRITLDKARILKMFVICILAHINKTFSALPSELSHLQSRFGN